MRDIRSLNLQTAEIKSISKTDKEQYQFSQDKLYQFERILYKLDSCSYWSPVYQAWKPLVDIYMNSGVNPELTLTWSPSFTNKSDFIYPKDGQHSPVLAELLRMLKAPNGEAFGGFLWSDIEAFYKWSLMLIENEKYIINAVTNVNNIEGMIDDLLQTSNSNGLSDHFHEAIYLFRNNSAEYPQSMIRTIQKLKEQATIYIDEFVRAFDEAAELCSDNQDIYGWYCDEIKSLIVRAWDSCTMLGPARELLDRSDVINLPVWISEQITVYINRLPCVIHMPTSRMYTFNALQGAINENACPEDGASLYAYTLNKSSIKNLVNTLNTFTWDVRGGKFFKELFFRIKNQHFYDPTTIEPREYLNDLISRGFPVKE